MVLKIVLVWAGAYVLGSIPSGIFWAWAIKHVDVRQHGSGRTGGTNVWRTVGFGPALLTAISDGFKGAIAVWIARALGFESWSLALVGTFAVVGHNYSIFLKFRGGAGTATSVGVVCALWSWWGVLFFVTLLVISGILIGQASVGSILLALLLPVVFLLRGEVAYAVGFGLVTMALTLWALRPNIRRILKREERFLPIYAEKPPPICLSRHPAVKK